MTEWQRWKGIMKCVPFEEKRLAKWKPPYIINIKYDGDRCKGYPLAVGYLLVSSEENPFFSIPHISQTLTKYRQALGQDLDGELYDHNVFLEGGHELIHSIASRKVNLHPRHKEISFHLFDIENGKPQIERIQELEKIKRLNIPHISVAPFWICNSLDEVKKVYDKVISQRYEGIIIRHLYNAYERKRSTFVMKFKPKKKDEYKIVGWKEEISKDGVPKGRIGSLIMSSQSGDEFGVSAGLDAGNKEYLWSIRGLITGLTAEVHYQHLTNKQIPKGTFDIKIPELGI